MNIHEYQAKQLLKQYGVTVPAGEPATAGTSQGGRGKTFRRRHKLVVVKSQIHAGGRGKGTFKSGFQGGVKLCKSVEDVYVKAKPCSARCSSRSRPARTDGSSAPCSSRRGDDQEGILPRGVAGPRERRARSSWPAPKAAWTSRKLPRNIPEKIIKEQIDPAVGIMPYQARKIAAALGLKGDLFNSACAKLLMGVYKTWWECDASMVEINPLCIVVGADGKESICAVDAKIGLDDNALYRHKTFRRCATLAEEAPLEIEASKFSLNYIKLDGSIACLVNGAGLAMATMDIIQHFGGMPANFLDVGGGASKDQVTAAFKIILQDPNVKGIFVNIFGGIMDCNVIATGIVAAVKETGLKLPLVVRLEGNNVVAGGEVRQT
jgi:succinyl-CoA synthetase beta subunit